MSVRLSLLISLLFGLASCATTPAPQAQKPYEQCICGPVQNAEGKNFCAIWGATLRSDSPQAVHQGRESPTCLPRDCSQFFSAFCQKIQMAPPRPASTRQAQSPGQPCYCDQTLIENDKGQVQLVCAAWRDGDRNLLEYYSVDSCTPQRCASAPFQHAARQCPGGFRSFYVPFQNKR
jgi:hypothetical protein